MQRLGSSFAFMLFTAAHGQHWTLDAYIGTARTHDGPLTLQQPNTETDLELRGVQYEGRSFQGPLYYGVRAGGYLTRRFALEGEFTHLKVFVRVNQSVEMSGTLNGTDISGIVPLNFVVERFSISHGVNLLLGNVVFRQRLDDESKAFFTVRAGLGTTVPHPETTIGGIAREQYEVGGFAWQLATGVEYRLWNGLYALGEYKFTCAHTEVDVAGGTADPLLRSHHLVFGVGLKF